GREPGEARRGGDRHRERGSDQPGSDDLHRAGHAWPDEDVKQHPEGGQRHDPAEQRRLDHHRSVASSSALVVSRLRNMARMIASPTAASAAATVITKNTITWPSSEPRLRAIATKARFTAFSMISIA